MNRGRDEGSGEVREVGKVGDEGRKLERNSLLQILYDVAALRSVSDGDGWR